MATGIDAQFHRAVDIVQSLPKGGPVQTSYEEKLALYALYKQATEGDIRIPRPGLLDMLGRAKWDSWNKQKGVDTVAAKRSYVGALLKILRKHPDPSTIQFTEEIESFGVFPNRPSSPSSSTSSYHSSQASPPDSPLQTGPSYILHPPDPTMPIPDVPPEIIPPSALNSSHRSLLNLLQSPAPPSEQSISALRPGTASRAHSLRESEKARDLNRPAIRGIAAAPFAPMPSVPPSPMGRASSSGVPFRQYSPLVPPPMTPDPYFPNPNSNFIPRPGSASTFSPAPPINVTHALQSIQLSLTALHERLSTLERSQAMLLRKEDRRRTWLSFLTEEDEVDELEDEADRLRRSNIRTGDTATTVRRKRRAGLPIRVVWALLAGLRRAAVDLGTFALMMLVVTVIFGGGWRRARQSLTRLLVRARGYLDI
ncbi:acyl CoA binding protein-domain-containing protein [Kockovaella imperatae]|uniref:Acyl CoA binding protein-domain-containing protein n=1 Tax=Kockovaella imperatae TaxID=4999 RepID=A0A1Y1UPX8_9TREE|nr:acyl CoA binding protein-domain-containing protein [Kockovaella imperatae]ORX40059.1 acyl CoA binding protein-domain-containing protein [Kockovaella imperatae]